jgi:hypothetical protein
VKELGKKISETDLAAALIAVLTQDGWKCYSEVQVASFGDRADVMATKNGILWVFECKLTPNLDVLGQALRWVGKAHYVSICTPHSTSNPYSNKGRFITDWIKYKGIGWEIIDINAINNAILQVSRRGDGKLTGHCCRYSLDLNPKLNRSAHNKAKIIINKLSSDMNNYTAGSGGAKYSTPFKRSILAVDQYLQQHGEAELGVMIDSISHHYNTKTSAISCIGQFVCRSKELYRTEGSGKSMKIFPR